MRELRRGNGDARGSLAMQEKGSEAPRRDRWYTRQQIPVTGDVWVSTLGDWWAGVMLGGSCGSSDDGRDFQAGALARR